MSYQPFFALSPIRLFNPVFKVEDKGDEENWPLRVTFGDEAGAPTLYLQYSEALSLAHSLRVACGAAEEGEAKGGTDD